MSNSNNNPFDDSLNVNQSNVNQFNPLQKMQGYLNNNSGSSNSHNNSLVFSTKYLDDEIEEIISQLQASEVELTTQSLNDLSITNAQAPTSVDIGASFNVSYNLIHEGDTRDNLVLNKFYLASDPFLESSYIDLYHTDVFFAVGPNETYPQTTEITLPSEFEGNYYLIYKADYINMIPESDETNNIAYRQITIGSSTPGNTLPMANDDTYTLNENTTLTIDINNGVLANDTDVDGDTLTVTLNSDVSNGTLNLLADGSFEYTPNADFVGNDIFTYQANDGTGNSTLATVNLTIIPENNLPIANDDTYTLNEDSTLTINAPGVLANDTDVDGDTLTATLNSDVNNGTLILNNDGSFEYTPNADFVGNDSFTYQANDGTGNSTLATVTLIINTGNTLPMANDDTYTLNEDSTLTINAPGVLANDTDVDGDTLTATLNSDVNNGTLILNNDGSFEYTPNADFFGIDSFTYYVNDGSTDNSNLATVKLTVNEVYPDLEIIDFNPPDSIVLGDTYSINYTIRNIRNIDAGANSTYFYLSEDNNLDINNDMYIDSDDFASFAGNLTSYKSARLSFREINVTEGDYYLFAVADGDNEVIESNENNNIVSSAITVNKTDLNINNFNAPETAILGDNITVSYTVENNSTYNASYSYTSFYLSEDNILDTESDIDLGQDYVVSILANASSNESKSINLNLDNISGGDYYLFAKVDGRDFIAETDEQNNISSQLISFTGADLTISNLNVNSDLTMGENIDISYTVNNIGEALADTHKTNFYLSSNQTYESNDDIYIGSNQIAPLDFNSSSNQTLSLFLDNNIPIGSYYVLAIADGNSEIIESNEDNNVTATSESLDIYYKDLSISSLNPPATITMGNDFTVDYTINNLGNLDAIATNTEFYLSTNDTFESNNDFYLGIDAVNALNSNSFSNESVTLTLGNTLSPGNYYLLAIADSNEEVYESNENNVFVQPITVELPDNNQLDLSIFDFTVPNDKISIGSTINIDYILTKTSEQEILTHTNRFYLSTDKTFDVNVDQLLGSDTFGVLSTSGQFSRTVEVTVDSTIQGGYYYLLAVADADSEINEVNENNNLTYKGIVIANNTYSEDIGYGLVNANAAVSRAIQQTLFEDVADLGSPSDNLDLIQVPEVWNQGFEGQGVTVAVLDTGFQIDHEDLSSNIWVNPGEIAGNGIDDDNNGHIDDVNGWDFYNDDNTVNGKDHGTHVAGIVGALNNGLGNTGVAPLATIMPVKVFADNEDGSWSAVEDGIYYAVDNGANVINMSLGATGAVLPSIKNAMKYAADNGVMVVSAAGNYSDPTPIYPAAFAVEYGLAVGAQYAGFSNRSGPDSNMAYVTADGSVLSTVNNNGYGGKQGTSMASPHVAGVVALMLSANPLLTVQEIREIIIETATPY